MNKKKLSHSSLNSSITSVLAALLCILIGLVVGFLVLLAINPAHAWGDGFVRILKGGFHDAPYGVGKELANAAPLIMTGLSVAFAFKTGLFNIGAAGQYTLGAYGALYCAIMLKMPWFVCLIAATILGGIWGAIPGFFKAKWNTNETLFTLMMNYVAIQLVAFFIIIWEVPKGAGKIGIINQNSEAGWLPVIGGKQYLLTILVVAVMTILMYIYLNYSKHGYEISVVGESERTARYVGIKVGKVIVRTMLLSGALCGIAGVLLVSGTDHTITTTIAGGQGFTAVMVSWLAKFNPIVMVFTSLLLVVLSRGASEISSVFSLNHSFADILTGIILFFIIGSEFFLTYKVSLRKGKKEA